MLLFNDGFDHYTTLSSKWDSFSQGSAAVGGGALNMTIASGGGRNSSGGLVIVPFNSAFTANPYVQRNIGTKSTVIVGFAVNINYASWYSDVKLLGLHDGITEQISLRVTSAGVLYITRNGTVLGTASQSLPGNTWAYIEVKATIDPSAGSAIVKLNGSQILSLTGQNTRTTANSYASAVLLGTLVVSISNNNGMLNCSYDDVYICDTSGSSFNDFIGDVAIKGALATGNGSLQDYTTNIAAAARSVTYPVGYTVIDTNSNLQRVIVSGTSSSSAPTWATSLNSNTVDGGVTWVNIGPLSAYKLVNDSNPDGDSSYISDATIGHQATFTFPSVIASSVLGVVINVSAEKDDGGARSIRGIAKSNGVVGDSGTDIALSGGYRYSPALLLTDPNTGAAWTQAGVNAAEFGIKTTV